ncbi:hypothetical protein C3K47_06960 [Solitalea longa]|uniref:TonB C-terminal domain-containing protein n=1 Tax=Solitalea longa TaxID=2079460 RepID=A0A2S5A5D6_9SPHI|nr:hypothetical protein [Solitalea longa]POY37497.1 hypothetical protein C3K47_06960 [Solitalea longa]
MKSWLLFLSLCICLILSCTRTGSKKEPSADRIPQYILGDSLPPFPDSSLYYQNEYFNRDYKSGNLFCYNHLDTTTADASFISMNILFENYRLISAPYVEKWNGYSKHLSDSVIFKRFGKDFYHELDSITKYRVERLKPGQIEKDLYWFADDMPEYWKGKDAFDNYIDTSIKDYQRKLRLIHQYRHIILVVDYNKKGSLSNIRLYQKLDPIRDSLSLLIINKVKNDWKPAIIKNKPVMVRTYIDLPW